MNGYREYSVAVIGMGPTGTSFVYQLMNELRADPPGGSVRLTVIDPSDEPGPGYAFDAPHRLNMRADRLSIDPRAPGDFAEWLRGQCHGARDGDLEYPSRKLFGQYLRKALAGSFASADPALVTVEHWRTSAVDLERVGGSFQVKGANGTTRTFSTVVMATGESRYGSLHSLAGDPTFIPSLAERQRIGDIPTEARVGVVGSSLSAVDVCIQLLGQGHQGPISCYSRTRGFPNVQGVSQAQQAPLISPQWLRRKTDAGTRRIDLRTVARAIADGLEARASEPYRPGLPDPREWFSAAGRHHRRQQDENQVFEDAVVAAGQGRTSWYQALDSLSPHTPAIWHAMAPSDQMFFLTRYRAVWNEYRHSMPLVNARLLLPAVRSGQLTIRTGLRAVSPEPSRPGHRWRFTTRSGRADPPYDVLIDATGGQLGIACREDPLLRTAIRRGLLVADPLGGVRVTFSTCRVISADGMPWPNLYLVGPMTFGTHFYTNSFETNRDNAFRVARHIRLTVTGTRPTSVVPAPGNEAIPLIGGR